MSCLRPTPAWVDETSTPAKVHFKLPLGLAVPAGWRQISVPCGKCFGCLRTRSLDITVRAIGESRMHDFCSFVTLTVADEHMSEVFPHGLQHRPFQLFLKRLRKAIGRFKFLMCGEYGSQSLRPHYHAILFGPQFVDDEVLSDGSYCPSATLRNCWPYGLVSVSEANTNRIAYVSGYTLKDQVLGRDKDFYLSRGLGLPYVKWSTRPALGLDWFKRYHSDLVSDEGLKFRIFGKPFNISGRYFRKKLQLCYPEEYARICVFREIVDTAEWQRFNDLARRCEVQQYQLVQKRNEV